MLTPDENVDHETPCQQQPGLMAAVGWWEDGLFPFGALVVIVLLFELDCSIVGSGLVSRLFVEHFCHCKFILLPRLDEPQLQLTIAYDTSIETIPDVVKNKAMGTYLYSSSFCLVS
jgi:hypothetical protein